jgi:hypothetical protein
MYSPNLRINLHHIPRVVTPHPQCTQQYRQQGEEYGHGDAKVFADGRESQPSEHQQRLESELRRAKDVIAEITAENLDLKKGLSD